MDSLDGVDDSSILAVIADRAASPDSEPEEFADLLKSIRDPEARRVAEVLIHGGQASEGDSPRVKQAVQGFRDWVRRNQTLHSPPRSSRSQRR